jgi:hypothetical protein
MLPPAFPQHVLKRIEMLRRIGPERYGQRGIVAQLPLDLRPATPLVSGYGAGEHFVAEKSASRPAQASLVGRRPGRVERILIDRRGGEFFSQRGQKLPGVGRQVGSRAARRMAFIKRPKQRGGQMGIRLFAKRRCRGQPVGSMGGHGARLSSLAERFSERFERNPRLLAIADDPGPAVEPAPQRGDPRSDPQRPARLSQRPVMSHAGMIVEMVKHHRPLAMVTAAASELRHLRVQLLDQALAVRRDDVHEAGGSAKPVEKRLPIHLKKKGGALRHRPLYFLVRFGLEGRHIGFVADEAHFRYLRLLGHRQHLVDQIVARIRLRLQVEFGNRVHLLRHVEILAQLG